ncbi:hypothetical protein [Nonomuraea fuscirosea]|uniref:hypothetical protein n=1 Tax=Nonomuraea fuscirosea TaxID=1291556 RepID=UPI00341836C3
MRTRRHALSAVLFGLAAMTACAAPSELPTLAEASRRLDSDAGDLLGATELGLSAVRRADDDTCVPGQTRHFFQAETDAEDAPAGLLRRLRAMGYDEVVDDLDLRDEANQVSVLRDPLTRVTFELTMLSGDRPGVRVVGKTICYASG